MHSAAPGNDAPDSGVRVRQVTTEHVWQWLSAGWRDILQAPMISLFYGTSLALVSGGLTLLVVVNGAYYMLPLLLAGFLLIAPLLGIGPYCVSQRLEQGEVPALQDAFRAFHRNATHILGMGVILMLSFLAWLMIANLILVLFHQGITPADWQGLVLMLFGSWEGAQLLVAGTYAGGMIALLVFAISAITVPMLVERPVNIFQAVKTSWDAVRANLLPMLLWAAVLVSIILASFLTLYAGLIIGFPLAAHATWHAYRDLVG